MRAILYSTPSNLMVVSSNGTLDRAGLGLFELLAETRTLKASSDQALQQERLFSFRIVQNSLDSWTALGHWKSGEYIEDEIESIN